MSRRRVGFTLIELLTSMTVIAILAGILIPKTGDFITRAKAASVVGDIMVVRDAVIRFNVDSSSYPATAAMGQVPGGLARYLPQNFSFVKTDYSLQYNNWGLVDVLTGYPSTTTIIGVTVETNNQRLGELVTAQLNSFAHYQAGQDYTFILIGL